MEPSWHRTLGTGIIYFKRDSLSEKIETGDLYMASGRLEKVQGPRNPGAFDYAKYLSRSDIFYSAYLSGGKWKLVEKDSTFNLFRKLNRLKVRLESYMLEVGVSSEGQAVISALTLGDKTELSQELKTSYSKAGVLHILAVSGLHVGIFYFILNFLLGFIEKLKRGKFLKAALVITLLWGYAVLTGMSPSVTRAATMFSFVVIGATLQKNTNIYNTLCVSAFFLLLYNPQSLFNVGFLLSYTAVFGIVYLYPMIYGAWSSKNWLLDKIWVLMSVSLAAQIVTFPLSLYYFHQFPNYFLLANVIVVPLATCIIYMTLVLFALIPIEFVAKPFASAISFMVDMLNGFVRWIEGLPFAITGGIEISGLDVIVIYLMIGTLIFYLKTKQYRYLFIAVSAILFMSVNQVVNSHTQGQQHRLIVYDVPKHSAFDIIDGKTSLLTTDSSLINDTKTIYYTMESNWRQLGVMEMNERILEETTDAMVFSVIEGKRVVFPLKVEIADGMEKVRVDFLILSDHCKVSVSQLSQVFEIDQLIIDSSVPNYKLSAIIEACEELKIPFFNVHDSGAFVKNL